MRLGIFLVSVLAQNNCRGDSLPLGIVPILYLWFSRPVFMIFRAVFMAPRPVLMVPRLVFVLSRGFPVPYLWLPAPCSLFPSRIYGSLPVLMAPHAVLVLSHRLAVPYLCFPVPD